MIRNDLPDLLTAREAAPLLRMSPAKVYDLIATDRFPIRIVRIGNLKRIPKRDLFAFIDGRKVAS